MANKPTPADFSPNVPDFPSIGQYQPIYGKFDLTTYIQGASDYEIMAFLVQCYNATLKGYSDVTQLSKDTVTAYNQLQTWVNTWFDNLDVKREVNEKLEQMRVSGELATVIASSDSMIPAIDNYFASEDGNAALSNKTSEKINHMAANGTLTHIVEETGQVPPAVTQYLNTVEGHRELSNATAQKIEEMAANGELGTVISQTTDLQKTTTDWLTANVTPVGSAVVVDKSLTIEGAAADSKATGNSIDSLKGDLGDIVTTYYNDKTGKVLGFANGDIGSTVSISSQSWCAHIKVSVIGGTKLYVKTFFANNYTDVPVVLFANSENLVVSKVTKDYAVREYHTEILDVPSDAKYAYINIGSSGEDVYNNCIAGINYTKISAKEEIDSLKSFDVEAVNRLSFCRIDDSIITSGVGYPVFTEGILNGWGTQSYITHRMFAVDSNKYYAFDANKTVYVNFLDSNKCLIGEKEYTTTSYWYHKIIDALPLNCSFLIIMSNPSNDFVQEPPVCYELFSSNDGIPEYYHVDSYIENKVKAIRNNSSIVNGCTFAFITDIHFFFNSLMSGPLLKYIRSNTPLNLIVCGGDIPPAYGTLEKLNKSAELYNNLTGKLGKDSWLTVKGNHDYCIDGDTPKTMTKGYQYNQIIRPLEISKAILTPGKDYYYYDLPSQKIRFIILDQYETTNSGDVSYGVMSNVTDEQLSWLANALSVEGYTFLVFSHSSCDSSISGYDRVLAEVNRMLCAVNNKRVYTHSSIHVDFTKTTSIVACSIAGHNHIDSSNTTDGLLSITTTSDAALIDGVITRTAGTISEQAFDVFTVDTENKKINAIRIGAGEDRSWTY